MINYSTCMRGNPTDKDAAKKAYANAQYSQVMTLDKFCYHIASHGCIFARRYPGHPYSCRGLPARAVVERTADTDGRSGRIFEQYRSLGAHSMAEFTVENITEVNVLWAPGVRFNNLRQDAEFQLVPHTQGSRRSSEGIEGGKTTVDLTGNSSAAGIAADDADASRIPAASGEPADENS